MTLATIGIIASKGASLKGLTTQYPSRVLYANTSNTPPAFPSYERIVKLGNLIINIQFYGRN